jgi:streptogramin lyase
LLSTFTVTSTGDSGAGTLRQAITDANANPGPDTINFDISQVAASGFSDQGVPDPTSSPTGIATGPDGKLWFTERNANAIVRYDPNAPSGSQFTKYSLPAGSNGPLFIQPDAFGALWFTENSNTGKIGRIDAATGTITEYATPSDATTHANPYLYSNGSYP